MYLPRGNSKLTLQQSRNVLQTFLLVINNAAADNILCTD